jgi:hypothetical protein
MTTLNKIYKEMGVGLSFYTLLLFLSHDTQVSLGMNCSTLNFPILCIHHCHGDMKMMLIQMEI